MRVNVYSEISFHLISSLQARLKFILITMKIIHAHFFCIQWEKYNLWYIEFLKKEILFSWALIEIPSIDFSSHWHYLPILCLFPQQWQNKWYSGTYDKLHTVKPWVIPVHHNRKWMEDSIVTAADWLHYFIPWGFNGEGLPYHFVGVATFQWQYSTALTVVPNITVVVG